jgi:hypothetical protein
MPPIMQKQKMPVIPKNMYIALRWSIPAIPIFKNVNMRKFIAGFAAGERG